MKYRKALWFVLLAYVPCWSIAFTYFGLGGSLASPWFALVAVACMFTPALSAIVVQKLICRERIAELGLVFRINRWYGVAALVPAVLVLLALALSAIVPGASLSSGADFIRQHLQERLSEGQIDRGIRSLEELGLMFPLLLVGGALLAGSTVNVLPALGEELGWRGLLQGELQHLGFWRSSLVVGMVWGPWHLPLIVHGFNYPGHPVLGVLMMTVLTVLLSPILALIRTQAGSVLAAAVFHGVLNAMGGLPLLFVRGGSSLTTGVTGAAGLFVLALANVAVFWWQRKRRSPRIPATSPSGSRT